MYLFINMYWLKVIDWKNNNPDGHHWPPNSNLSCRIAHVYLLIYAGGFWVPRLAISVESHLRPDSLLPGNSCATGWSASGSESSQAQQSPCHRDKCLIRTLIKLNANCVWFLQWKKYVVNCIALYWHAEISCMLIVFMLVV